MFTRVDVPKEILSDQGSQFLSAVMKGMCILLSLKQTEEQRGEVMELFEEFQDVFTDVLCLTNLGKHSITLTIEVPIYSKPYSLLLAMQKEVEKELDDMLKLGIIEPPRHLIHYQLSLSVNRMGQIESVFRKLNKVSV